LAMLKLPYVNAGWPDRHDTPGLVTRTFFCRNETTEIGDASWQ
jgi:hypothetical protein